MEYKRKRTFKYKIIISSGIVLIALAIALNLFHSFRFSSVGNALITEKLSAIANSLQMYLDECMANSRAAVVSMSNNSEVAEAIAERDADELTQMFSSVLGLYRMTFFKVADSEGRVLATTYEAGAPIGSMIDTNSLKEALDGKVSSHYESGDVIKVSVCTGAPVYDKEGRLVGAISAGIRFDLESEVEKLKELFDAEVTVLLGDIRLVTTMTRDGASIVGTKVDEHIEKIVVEGKQEYFGDADILGEQYKTFYRPLIDDNGVAFATIFLGLPMSGLIAETNHTIREGILLCLFALIASITLLYIIISQISHPITKLSQDMRRIADGDLSVEIDVNSNDEVGDLANSLTKVASTLRTLLEDIAGMIREHKQGNVDYFMDTDKFLGGYKTLAKSIVELSAFGMKDQLTGIPNRRSLDYRLEVEWRHAMRAKQPISLLMMDIDKFKNYNDNFGHQQGDVTLKSIAHTIKHAINRSVDLAARWGGEEFVVLLPDTDSPGAASVAERIRKAVEDTVIPCQDERGRRATISIGVNTVLPTPGRSIASLLAAADNALYKAKESGRNKVVVFFE